MANLSVFDKHFKAFSKGLNANSKLNTKGDSTTLAVDVFEDKPFGVQFRPLYLTTGLLATVAQVINALMLTTIIAYILHSVGGFLPVWVAIVLALTVTVLVEISKRNTTKIGAKYLLKYKYLPIFIALPFLILTTISFTGAYFGAMKLPELYLTIEQKTDSTNIELYHTLQAEITRLDAEIEQGKGDLLKKDNWSLRNRTLPQLEQQRANLVNERLALGEKIADGEKNEAAKSEAERSTKVAELQVYVLAISLFFEFLFLACTVFAYYYLWRCYVETLPIEEVTEIEITPLAKKPVPVISPIEEANTISLLPQSSKTFDFSGYPSRYETVLNCKAFDTFSKAANVASNEADYQENIVLANKALSIIENDVQQAVKQYDINADDVIKTYLQRFNANVNDAEIKEFKQLVQAFVDGKTKDNPFAEKRLIGFKREQKLYTNTKIGFVQPIVKNTQPSTVDKNRIGFKYNQRGDTPSITNTTVTNATVPVVAQGEQQAQAVVTNTTVTNATVPVVALKEGYKVCEHCGKAYKYTVSWQKFCSNKGEGNCKDAYHTAKNGGVPFNPKRYHNN